MEYYVGQTENNLDMHFDDERPPIYNAEDYAAHLRKYSRTGGRRDPTMVIGDEQPVEGFSEMGLRQFSTVSQLLQKLQTDLHLSFHSFLKEFVAQPNDGVTLLLDLLKVIQLSQTNSNSNKATVDETSNKQQVLRKALSDEHQALLCLKLCSETEEGALRMSEHPSGLFTVSVCVMSNFTKSRVLALQVLSRMCSMPNGHRLVVEAVSMLRLRFGEPVRFKFLIGMLNSFNSPAFQLACVRFLNTFIGSASSAKERVHIQCELEEAGLDIDLLSKMHEDNSQVKEELQIWGRAYIDVDQLVEENLQLRLDAEELRNTGKELRERLAVFEAGKSYMEDNTRWVEGSSDMERQEESFNCNYRSGNTVVIACNAEPSSVRRLPRRSRVSRVEVVTSDTSDSDKSSFSENRGAVVEMKVGAEVEDVRRNVQHLVLRDSVGAQPVTALNRCKSFFGLRTDVQQGRTGDGLTNSKNGDFVLKGDSGCARREVKRSRSMDVLKSRVLRRQASKSRVEEGGLLRESYRSKQEYVSNWAREAFLSGALQEEPHNFGRQSSQNISSRHHLDSFYSLYSPGEQLGDQDPTYLSMNNNNNLHKGSLAANFESNYY